MRSRVTGPFSASLTPASITIQQTEFHNMTSANINASGGAFVAFGDGLAMAANISQMELTYTAGEPLGFRVAASAAAAAALSSDTFILNQGDGPVLVNCVIAVGSKIWVRSRSANAVASGYITANLMG